MSLTFEQILLTIYQENFALGQFSLADNNDGKGTIISQWNVPQINQPTHDEVMSLGTPAIERLFYLNELQLFISKRIQIKIDSTALSKGYADAISCCSYCNSSNTQWKTESLAFIVWRDTVWDYAYQLLAAYQNNSDPLPTPDFVLSAIPGIQW
jgi:hypothetical protein